MLKWFVMLTLVMGCIALQPLSVNAMEGGNGLKIMINIPSRTLFLYEGGKVVKTYPVGIGTEENQTPIGKFKIVAKELNPVWIKPGAEETVRIESGPDNPLGYRWMEFAELYGIHGTNRPDSIGKYVSNGCVRMQESDVESLYEIVPIGTPVEITYERMFFDTAEDGSVFFRIYPDEYGLQPISWTVIEAKLKELGLYGAVDKSTLLTYINQPNGNPLNLGRVFSIRVYGKNLEENGIYRGGSYYLPVVPVAVAQTLDVQWDIDTQTVHSAYGSARGYVKADLLYIKAEDAYAVFGLYANWNGAQNVMQMETCLEPNQ